MKKREIEATCSINVCVKLVSLSYHASTFTRFPSTTRVIFKSATEANWAPIISEETNGSLVTANKLLHLGSVLAFANAPFTSSTDVSFDAMKVTSTIDPTGTGTLIEIPSNLFSSSVCTFVVAIAAPVEVGIIF